MSWNQGNNGNGYQAQPQYGANGQQEDVYGRLNNAREAGGARFPFIEDGTHRLALASLEEFQHSTDGPSARALFEVLASSKHAVGSHVVKIWKLVKPNKYKDSLTDGELFADFCRKMKGAPVGYPIGNDIRVLMKERVNDQLARGTIIECVGVPNKKGTWVNIYWNTIQQSPEAIAAMRQRMEQKGIPDTGGRSTQPAQNQYQGAPHPSQMPAQYPAQAQQAPVAAPTTAPQGGFLAQIPPAGPQGPQGGNTGGGTW